MSGYVWAGYIITAVVSGLLVLWAVSVSDGLPDPDGKPDLVLDYIGIISIVVMALMWPVIVIAVLIAPIVRHIRGH